MTTSTERKQRTITMTNRSPVKIYDDEWPVIAEGSHEAWDNTHKFQANRTWDGWIKVRQHADGRRIVYGCDVYTTQWQGASGYRYCGGLLLSADADISEAVRDLAGQLMERGADEYMRQVAHECIANLPPEQI